MNSIKEVINYLETLSASEQVKLLAKLSEFKKEGAYSSSRKNSINFIKRLKDEIASAQGHGRYDPRDINNSTLNLIILEAKHAFVGEDLIMELEKLAYRGLVQWANEYGYLSEQDEAFAAEHLTNFMKISKSQSNSIELIKEEKTFLTTMFKNNFYSEYIKEIFEDLTGQRINE